MGLPVPGTANDAEDMRRMDRNPKLNRIYTVTTIVGWGVVLGLTWPYVLSTGTLSLTNGGPAGAVWVYVAVCICMATVVVSMAEMASIHPNAGGQYYWVSLFAPRWCSKFLSYMVGWMCALGWQSAVAGSANIGAQSIQGLVIVRAGDSYHAKVWQLVLLTIAILVLVAVFNIFLAKKLPWIEAFVFVLYMLVFFALIVVLFCMGDRSSAKTVFTDFQDNAGWGSIGTACFVSSSVPVITIIGADSSVHLGEELKDASRQLPKAMLITAFINYLVGFLMLLAFDFVVGDVTEVLATSTGVPYIQVIWNATQSKGATGVFVGFIIIFFIFTDINVGVTASRQIWAFARDNGLPFSKRLSYVSPSNHIPNYAVLLSCTLGCCITLILFFSTPAFLNIPDISVCGLMASYIIVVSCRLWHRNWGPAITERPSFYMSKPIGNMINVIAIMFLVVVLVAVMFPVGPRPTTGTANWTPVALGGTVGIALFAYFPGGLRKAYLRPEAENLWASARGATEMELDNVETHDITETDLKS